MNMSDKIKILVVDHVPDVLLATSRLLKEAGYEVLEASTGKECLGVVRKSRPDLVCSRWCFPIWMAPRYASGLKPIRVCGDLIVVLLFDVRTSSETQVEGLEAGADGYILRPIPDRELLARVQSLVRFKQAEEALRRACDELEERAKERTADLARTNEHLVASEESLEERLRFETLLSEISARFVEVQGGKAS